MGRNGYDSKRDIAIHLIQVNLNIPLLTSFFLSSDTSPLLPSKGDSKLQLISASTRAGCLRFRSTAGAKTINCQTLLFLKSSWAYGPASSLLPDSRCCKKRARYVNQKYSTSISDQWKRSVLSLPAGCTGRVARAGADCTIIERRCVLSWYLKAYAKLDLIDPVFFIPYYELYYHHVYSCLRPSIDDRFHSYENRFNYLLSLPPQ